MKMWPPGASGVDTARWPQASEVPDKGPAACRNSATRIRASQDYSRETMDRSEWESKHLVRRALGAIRLLASTPKHSAPSKFASPLPPPINGLSHQYGPAVNGHIGTYTQHTAPTQHRAENQLSIMQMEFFGKCYFEVNWKETPAGMLEQLTMVLMSDEDNHKAQFVKIQKHFDCALNLAIETLKVRALVAEGDIMVFDDLVNIDLLHIEVACTKLPKEYRGIIFAHLADHLPFPMCFLLAYARFLRVTSSQQKLRGLLERLRVHIDKEMPEQLQHYEWEFSIAKRLQWQQQADVHILEPGTICEQTIDDNLLPLPKFQWTETTEQLLWSILETKMSMIPAEEKGGPSDSDRLVLYVNEKVVTLWPEGWMDAETILQEVRRRL